jgi:Nucleotidyltransferase
VEEASLLTLLKRVDRSFARNTQHYSASNGDGFLVDLIKPMRNPPWRAEGGRIGGEHDLDAVEIEGLAWLESAPAFEAVVIDERGGPLRIVTSDPRVFGAHKIWLSNRIDRSPLKRRRDSEQGRAVLNLCRSHFPHLPFTGEELRMLPREVFDAAAAVYSAA